MTFSRVSVIVAVTAVLVYLGLNFLLPRNQKEKAETGGLTTDQVFGESASATAAPAAGAAAPVANTAPPAEAAAPAAATANTSAPAAAEPAAAADAGLSSEEARKIAENVSREVATRVAESTPSAAPAPNAAPAPSPAPAPEPAAAAPEPEPAAPTSSASSGSSGLSEADVRRIAGEAARQAVREALAGREGTAPRAAKSRPAADVETAAAPASPAPAAHPAAATPVAKAESGPAVRNETTARNAPVKGGHAAVDVISSWWPAADKQSADALNLVYAGEAASEKSVVLLFGSELDAAGAGSHIQLLDAKGAPASGPWVAGGNPRILVHKDVKPGRYTVILMPDLADSAGKTLGHELHGPVYVH